MRVLADDMEPYTGSSLEVQQGSFRMPSIQNNAPGAAGGPCGQFNPTTAAINGTYYVAFEDTSTGPTAIKIRTLTNLLITPQTSAIAVSAASANAQTSPSMAANGNNLFVAWESQGSIFGNTVDSSLTPGTQKSIGTGTAASVAATSTGWVVVWQNGTDVEMAHVDASGTPGATTKVNDAAGATHPAVAAFGANVAVIWVDGAGHILVQRFDASGNKVAGDQTNSLESTTLNGNQSAPSIAAGTNFFVASWVDGGSGHVRARFLDGSGGFLYNWVNGQNTDFQVSTVDGHKRNTPVAAVGGSGAFVSIAWEDDTTQPGPGIWARRFPLPQQ